jgi:hypothetical protein
MFTQNKYSIWYYNIITKAQARQSIKPNDIHHILPRCLGGDNSKNNLVELTRREHYIVHLLLTKFTVGDAKKKMFYALHRITNTGDIKIKSSRIFEYLRSNHSAIVSGRMKENNPNKNGRKPTTKQSAAIRKANTDRVWSLESKLKMSKSKSGVSTIQPPFTDEHKRNLSKARSKHFSSIAVSCTWSHQLLGQFTGTAYELANNFPLCGLTPGELKKVTSDKYPGYKSHKGWTT